MMPIPPVPAHDLPQWSPFAVTFGLVCGFLLGAFTTALYAWKLTRTERLAGSGAVKLTPAGERLYRTTTGAPTGRRLTSSSRKSP